MAILCNCNAFNEKVVREGVFAKMKDFPKTPIAKDIYQLYRDVYAWCGLNYQDRIDAKPRCHICFEDFIELVLKEALSEKLGSEQAEILKTQALDSFGRKKTKPMAAPKNKARTIKLTPA